ncbi:MAG TPA: hypothetical protein VM870_03230, partial [Pyrinomonadaceae bacterium]|nr:hypothetical protein [Pyrinomonadaceae bacterium]
MDKNTIQKIAREVLDELHYQGWEVSAVWQQKAIAMPKTTPANGNGGPGNNHHTSRKTWYVDFTNDQGSFPRVYFHCDSDVDEAWISGEIKQQLQNLRGKLTFMEPLRPAVPTTPETIAPPPPPAPVAVTAPLSPPVTKPLPPPAPAPEKSFVPPPVELEEVAAPVATPSPRLSREEQNTALLRAASEGRAD